MLYMGLCQVQKLSPHFNHLLDNTSRTTFRDRKLHAPPLSPCNKCVATSGGSEQGECASWIVLLTQIEKWSTPWGVGISRV